MKDFKYRVRHSKIQRVMIFSKENIKFRKLFSFLRKKIRHELSFKLDLKRKLND